MDLWHDELERATTECELLHYADDFLQLWTPRGIAAATFGLDTLRIENAEHLLRVHVTLVGRHCNTVPGDARAEAQMRELSRYIQRAVARLKQVRAAALSTPAEPTHVGPAPGSERAEWARMRRDFR